MQSPDRTLRKSLLIVLREKYNRVAMLFFSLEMAKERRESPETIAWRGSLSKFRKTIFCYKICEQDVELTETKLAFLVCSTIIKILF